MQKEETAKVINLHCGIRKGDRGITSIKLDNNWSFCVHSDIAEWLKVTLETEVKMVFGKCGIHYYVDGKLLK
jgi:hypothetical protein